MRSWLHVPVAAIACPRGPRSARHAAIVLLCAASGCHSAPSATTGGTGGGGGSGGHAPSDPCQTGQAVRGAEASSEEFNGPFASWKSVKSYGAVGDGKTDDTAALQMALDDLKAVKTNTWSVLYFPPGAYLVTAQLTTTRSAHSDYLGGDIVGDDPATTSLVWGGPAGGTILQLDAWYNKVSRLTFDGKGTAAIGLVRAGQFATYGELSDLEFKDFTSGGLLLGNGMGQGIAEQAVLRDRFYRSNFALSTWNYNTLDIYVWSSYFEDNVQAIRNATGAYHAYQNRFVRSKTGDLWSATNMQSSVVGNVSVGSTAFLSSFQASAHLQGNLVYAASPDAFDLTQAHAATLLDNVVVLPGGADASKIPGGNDTLMVGNVFVGTNAWPMRPVQQPFDHAMGGSYVVGHPIEDAVDGDPSTWATLALWEKGNVGLRWDVPLGARATVTRYAITANGASPNDYPADFGLYGSNDWGNSWIALDNESGQAFTPKQRREYTIATPAPYAIYDLRITKNAGPPSPEPWVSIGELELEDAKGDDILKDPGGLLTGADEGWGNMTWLDQEVLPDGKCGAAPELTPWPHVPKVARKVFDVAMLTGDAIQKAIDQAAKEPAGSKPVVHLPKGAYAIKSSVTVPAGVAMSIVGDGGSEDGTVLSWAGASTDPVLVLAGPSRATLRDLDVVSTTGDGLAVKKADQPGGRVYSSELWCSGVGGTSLAAVAADIDGIEQSDVTMTAFGLDNFFAGVRATGGPVRAKGGKAPGQVAYLTGGTSAGNRNYDVRKNGQLAVTAVWYEGDWAYQAPLIDLDASSSGTLTFIASHMTAQMPTFPLIGTSGFAGSLSLLNDLLDHRDVTHLDFQGDGSSTQVFGFGNDYPMFSDPNKATKTPDQLWVDTTSPGGKISQVGIDGTAMADDTDKKLGVAPDASFVRAQVAQLRGLRIEPPSDRAAGVTDVKIFRVLVTAGPGRTACAVRAD